ERKPRKGQNRIKTGQKREAFRKIWALERKDAEMEGCVMHNALRSSFLPIELKELRSKVNAINGMVGETKNLLNKVAIALDRFATAIESTSHKAGESSVPSDVVEEEFESGSDAEIRILEEIENQKGIEQIVKDDVAKSEIKKAKQDLINLVGLDVVEILYMDKVKYDKYCLKTLKQRAKGITKYVVLSKGKGHIYKDDGSEEII
nr:hypothetical protein [Tanacetum cinerariifolium]